LTIDRGDIFVADLGMARRRRVLVVSRAEFNRVAGVVVVAGELKVPVDGIPYPWRIQVGDAVFALDLLRTIEPRRLLDPAGRAGYDTVAAVRRALTHIT
jgi:mRNA-degrading endonuclease toxin of MazEF toxin-antitoxin module